MSAFRGLPLLQLVADGVRIAQADVGTCAGCGLTVRPGQRIADLPDGRGIVHVARCAATAATAATAAARPRPRRRTP